MQPPPRNTPPGAGGPPPPSGGPNAFRRNRPYKPGAMPPAAAAVPPSQPMTDPFAFARQGSSPAHRDNQAPPLNRSPLPMQASSHQTAQYPAPQPGAQVPLPGFPHSLMPTNVPHADAGYFTSQESVPYIAQLPNSTPPFGSSALPPPAASTPPVVHSPPFPADHGSRPPSVQNYFQPTSDPPHPFHPPPHAQAPPLNVPPHPGPPSQNNFAPSLTRSPPNAQPQNSHFPAQNYFSQSGGVPEQWYSQDHPSQRACPVPYSLPPADPGTLSMFFKGNDVENEETLAGDGQINGVHFPNARGVGTAPNPGLNQTGPPGVTPGPGDSVENLECAPNLEVLPSEPAPSQVLEGGVSNVEMPDPATRPARSASVSSNVSHSSGHAPHGGVHLPRRNQGGVGTFIQQESPRPLDPTAAQSSAGGYFEQIDSPPAPQPSPTFPTPSPPKPVGVFHTSANSSFEPVRSHSVGVRPAEVDRARIMMEKGGNDVLPGNLEHPPDNMETIYLPGGQERRPSSRTQGRRKACDSPATTLWAQNDLLGTNILLAPAAPPLVATLAPARQPSAEVIQPPEDGPLDLQPPRGHLGPLSENLENPPDSASQASSAYASLLVTTPAAETVLIAPPSLNYSMMPPQIQSPNAATSPISQVPQTSPSANQTSPGVSQTMTTTTTDFQLPLNLALEVQDAPPAVQQARPPDLRSQSAKADTQPVVSPNSQLQASAPVNQNQPADFGLLDFSMHQSQSTNQIAPPPAAPPNNAPGFYLQVTKDAQQAPRPDGEPQRQPPASNPPAQSNQSATNPSNPALQGPPQYQPLPQATSAPPTNPPEGSTAPNDPQRPSSALGGQQPYGAAPRMPPGPGYGSYYPEYQDGRTPYPPQYPVDPRASNYYQQDDSYRPPDPRYGWYNGQNPAYRDAERQPERPSSRTSQYSDRSSSRQGYADDYRSNRSAYDDYASYYMKQYEQYMDQSRWYDPRYRGYYDPIYGWYNYDPEAYRRAYPYPSQQYPNSRESYDDPWRYYPGYDSSFDDDCRRRDPYRDDMDRRSVHSERSTHSRRSSFSSRSQQSQVYRSQTDLVAASYDPTASSLPVDYSYGQFPNQGDTTNYPQYDASDSTWTAPEQTPSKLTAPEKYTVPHCCARFGPAGQLVLVQPNLPSAGQPALVELHSMETMMQNSPEQAELRAFPGPLFKEETHKVDVIKFSQNKAKECMHNDDLIDKDSAFLIWEFIVLLCRQNGTVVGTDIADLLLKEHRSVWLPGKSPNEANLIDFTDEALERPEEEGSGPLSLLSDTYMGVAENVGKETERFRELLLFGRKKDALESAMKNGLWGHALLLASKMDSRTHAKVMTRFANSLPINDPLQTVYQLMSGRMPAAATCCGDEKWGDWRPHLAMVLSNLTNMLELDTRTISTMGDTLASKGLVDAAHFCYLMAQVEFGVFTKKNTKMVLIGSNHSLPFVQFCTSEAIQRTEAYEYAQSLGSHPQSLPNFQVFKFIYACRLAETGLCAQAFHYCEVIARTLLTLPSYHSPVFVHQLIQMSERLRFFDPQLKEKPEQELFQDPDWLLHLKNLSNQSTNDVMFHRNRRTSHLSVCSSQSTEETQSPADPLNPLMTSLMPQPDPSALGVQLMPPAPVAALQDGPTPVQQPVSPQTEGVPFYPPPHAPPPQPGFIHQDMYPPSMPTLSPTMPLSNMPPPMPLYQPMEMPPQLPHTVGVPTPTPSSPQQFPQPSSPTHAPPQMDFYDNMANLSSGRRSRTTSQSSSHLPSGRRSRTTSESSTHSGGRSRSNSLAPSQYSQSPPPPTIPEAPPQEVPKLKAESPKKQASGRGFMNWFYRQVRKEAHLPDDKNKSIVWDEMKQKWVNLDEPEEEHKPPPPPPTMFPKAFGSAPGMGPGPGGPPGGSMMGPPVNVFSRKAGTKARYVDVLNPSRSNSKPTPAVAPPADLFAPLAPMAMPTNLFVPSAAPNDQQPLEGSVPDCSGDADRPSGGAVPQMFNPNLLPSGPEGTQSGELPAQAAPPSGGVTFYNPSQFAQPGPPARSHPGRLKQREYPPLK